VPIKFSIKTYTKRDSLIKKQRKKRKKSSVANRRALSRRLAIKKGRGDKGKKKFTLFELETRWTVGHNEVVAF
jgi:hypothetical protein